jgi:hypothetical protein
MLAAGHKPDFQVGKIDHFHLACFLAGGFRLKSNPIEVDNQQPSLKYGSTGYSSRENDYSVNLQGFLAPSACQRYS